MGKKEVVRKATSATPSANARVVMQEGDRNEIGRRRRKLWLHAGGEKAGSSALQNSVGQLAAQLGEHGVAYANNVAINSPLEFTNGNGKALFDGLTAPAIDRQALQSLLLSYFSVHRQAICSSECFCRVELPRWKLLADLCDHLNIELHIVYYVRDVIDHFLAQYDQHVKHHWEWREIGEWMVGFPWRDASALSILSNVLAADRLHVRHYVSGTTDMLRSFLEILGLSAVADKAEHISRIWVNRSLTNYERERLKGINKHFYYLQTGVLADRILYANPNLMPEPAVIPAGILKGLHERAEGDRCWINKTFFPKGSGVAFQAPGPSKLKGESLSVARRGSSASLQAVVETERVIAEWAFEGLAKTREEAFLWVAEVLQRIKAPAECDPRLPTDFDPVAYLFKNFDLLNAGVEPYSHFLQTGHCEGRNWSWAMNIKSPWTT